jgi:hypothetical protein
MWSRPDEQVLRNLLAGTEQTAWIVSPFVSNYGVSLLRESIPDGVLIEVWTRLSVPDWAGGYSDPQALFSFLSPRMDDGHATLWVGPRLHAKAFVVDGARGIGGSANLTAYGLERNVEIWTDSDIPALIQTLEEQRNGLREVTPEEFKAWVDRLQEFEYVRTVVNDAFEIAGNELPAIGPVEQLIPVEDFLAWCRAREAHNAIAKRAVDFLTNRTAEQTSGHMIHAYYAAQMFFDLAPEALALIRTRLEDEAFPLEATPELQDWLAFLDIYRDYEDASLPFRTRTLLSYMTPALGGLRQGGGGGDYKVRIGLRLVADFI